MTLILKLFLIFVPQDADWPRLYLTVASKYLQDERWLAELEATTEQRRKVDVWFKRQKASLRKREAIAKKIREAREQGDFDSMLQLREDKSLQYRSMHELDQKMVGKILNDDQLDRFRQLVHWRIYGEKSFRNVSETLASAPLKNFQAADLKKLIPQRKRCQEEGKALVKQHELELHKIIEQMTSEVIYQRIQARKYDGIKLVSPFKSLDTLEYFADECRHPREKVTALNDLRQKVIANVNSRAGSEDTAQDRQANELEALKGVYELVDETIIERKFNRLSTNFLMKSLNEFMAGGNLT